MKKKYLWMMAAILIICTVTMVFTSCTDNADNAVAEPEQPLSDKEMRWLSNGAAHFFCL
jgi:hypothetical protein